MTRSNDDPLQDPSSTPQDIVVRNLRRRLWAAIVREEPDVIWMLYTATRENWEAMILQEQKTRQQAREKSRGGMLQLKNLGGSSRTKKLSSPDIMNPSLQGSLPDTDPLLVKHFAPLDPFVEDDFIDPNAPYLPVDSNAKRKLRRDRHSRRGVFAVSALLGRGTEDAPTAQKNESNNLPLTTPLHEAARMGSGKLVRSFLEYVTAGDPSVRNGLGHSSLHCAAGGINRMEEHHCTMINNLALRAPRLEMPPKEESGMTKRTVRVISRFFRKRSSGNVDVKDCPTIIPEVKLEMDRIDAVLALLAWSSSDKNSLSISTNAVDDRERTALHYAAEMGRTEICHALLSRTETFLTLIDQQRKTPCDLAHDAGHQALAAHLEARALLYRDPYGMDDELMAQIMQNSPAIFDGAGTVLASPFSWFTTYEDRQIEDEMHRRIEETLTLIKGIVSERSAGEKSVESLLGEPVKRDLPNVDIRNFELLHSGHIEVMLQEYGWNVKNATRAFAMSPFKTFEKCRIPVPTRKDETKLSPVEEMCLICCETFPRTSPEWKILQSCGHGFCRPCLADYILNAAHSNSQGSALKCPHHNCNAPLAHEEVSELAPDQKTYDGLVAISCRSFVMSNEMIRYCPHPDCPCVVRLTLPKFVKEAGLEGIRDFQRVGGVCAKRAVKQLDQLSYEGVDDPRYFKCNDNPEKAHRFCFACGELDGHWPLECDKLGLWKHEVGAHIREVEGGDLDGEDFNSIAQRLWMKANTRPCPKCEIPIEKNQGCNHMTCTNPACNYEFCWICRNDWRLHSTQTGGFFRCNRWQENRDDHEYYDTPPAPEHFAVPTDEDLSDPARMRVIYGTAMHESLVARKRAKEMDRFIHHYHRWSAHSSSRKLESSMGRRVCQRMKPVLQAARDFTGDSLFDFFGKGFSFLYAAFAELDECRSVLLNSYPYAYYRYALADRRNLHSRDSRSLWKEKKQYEKLQLELEMLTEHMSDIVARDHLRANESQIQFLTISSAQKRTDFTNFIMNAISEEMKQGNRFKRTSESENDHVHSLTRITGTSQVSVPDTPLEGTTILPLPSLDDGLQQSVEEFQLRMEANELSEVDSEGFVDSDGSPGEAERDVYSWNCPDCTFINAERDTPFCEVCGRAMPEGMDT